MQRKRARSPFTLHTLEVAMFWLMLALLVIIGALFALRRRRSYESVEDEPWRASLAEEDEPLDMEEARRAEEEFLADSWEEDEEPWRG